MIERVRGAAAVVVIGRGKCRSCRAHQGNSSTWRIPPAESGWKFATAASC